MRRYSYVLSFIFFMFLLLSVVKADDTCPLDKRTSLGAMAANINIVYEEVVEEVYDPFEEAYYSDYYIDVKVYNMNSQLRILVTNDKFNDEHEITYQDMDGNGIITLRQKAMSHKVTYTFEILGTYGDCFNHSFKKLKVTLPKFNYYSQYSLCDEISEFYMCQRYVMYDFEEPEFLEGASAYYDKKMAQENEMDEDGEIKDNTTAVSVIAKKVSDNKILVAGIIIALGIVVTIIIVIKRKRSVF